MVAAQDVELVGVLHFEGEQQTDCLEALFAAVDIIPQEQIARIGRKSPILKEPQQIIVLPVYIPYITLFSTADAHRGLHLNQTGLINEYLSGGIG